MVTKETGDMPSPPTKYISATGDSKTLTTNKKPFLQLLSKEYVSYLESYESNLIAHFTYNDELLE